MNLWEREWTINTGPDDVFLESGKTTFVLEKNGANGGCTFDVLFKRDEMPAEWNDCTLVARGTEPFKLEGDPLPKFDESVRDKYNQAIKKALSKTTTSTRRLEGELDAGLERKAVYLFMARDAVGQVDESGDVTLHDLLVLKRATLFPWSSATAGGVPIDDGTAHGNPK
jgi:hypothetical protein